jgi:hypothetical protein
MSAASDQPSIVIVLGENSRAPLSEIGVIVTLGKLFADAFATSCCSSAKLLGLRPAKSPPCTVETSYVMIELNPSASPCSDPWLTVPTHTVSCVPAHPPPGTRPFDASHEEHSVQVVCFVALQASV